MFWVIVWAFIAFGVLGFAGWSFRILFQQKACWEQFAKKHGLEINRARFSDPVSVTGAVKGRQIQIYSIADEQAATRSTLTHTHIEVFVDVLPPAVIVAARRPLPTFMMPLEQAEPLNRGDDSWPRMGSCTTDDASAALPWFTPRRTEALKRLMTLPQDAQTFFIADGSQCYLLWRSTDPLETSAKLNAVVKQLFLIAGQFDYDEEKGATARPSAPTRISARSASPQETAIQSPDQTADRNLPPDTEM